MQANAPCESTATDNAGKRLSHFLPGRLPTLSSLKKLDRCAYCIPGLRSYDNELTANTNGGRLTVMGTTTSTATFELDTPTIAQAMPMKNDLALGRLLGCERF